MVAIIMGGVLEDTFWSPWPWPRRSSPWPRKLACPRLEDSTIFWIVKILWSAWKMFWKTFFCGDRLKNFCEDFFPWPREVLPSERLSLALDFFCLLGLEPCVLDSTSGHNWHQWSQNLRTNYEQLRLNIGKKIITASLNSNFTDSHKKRA